MGIFRLKRKTFSIKKDNREDVPAELLKKAEKDGVIQEYDGSWRIISLKAKKFWDAHYKSRESASEALRAYQANKH